VACSYPSTPLVRAKTRPNTGSWEISAAPTLFATRVHRVRKNVAVARKLRCCENGCVAGAGREPDASFEYLCSGRVPDEMGNKQFRLSRSERRLSGKLFFGRFLTSLL
jgi:hypothetical protein